ncbi:MAG: L-fucose:H+ symporter permease [Bacteroidetes bacterium]|nr:L-fucose:H+ symporter permease [Bacteroidota bacterium]
MALPASSATMANPNAKKNYLFPFILVTSLFFFWGFVHNLDPVLMPHLKKTFRLNYLQTSLVDTSVFFGYFFMALPGGFIIRRYGFKAGIIIGLLLFAIGCFLFVPAANTVVYPFFLVALFIVACGLTLLETAANPYATILGDPKTATQRLNFAQSFNGLAVVVAPYIGGRMILSGKEFTKEQMDAMPAHDLAMYLQSEADRVKLPYTILGVAILLIAILFLLTKLPESKDESSGSAGGFRKILRIVHLRGAVIAQFFYVGAQVCVASYFINVVRQAVGMDEKTAKDYLGIGYGSAFVAGRFIGTFLMKYVTPQRLLSVFAFVNIFLSAFVIFSHGMVVVIALIAIAFFMSIMFPTIFALGIKDLNPVNTKMGSSLIIMAIVGGAILPAILGRIADVTNIQYGYVVPLLCFIVVAWYGLAGYKIKNID